MEKTTRPEITPASNNVLTSKYSDIKIRLHETWGWTSGDKSKGQSIIEEI